MDDLEKSSPVSEGMVEAEGSGKKGPHHEFCLNCGTKLADIYCHHCGQKDIPPRQTLGELWSNFIGSFWSYEGKFFQTAKYIIIRPGFLAEEYNKGRRESYFHPARMYVFVSFIFFLLYYSLPDEDNKVEMTEKDKQELSDSLAKELKSTNVDSILSSIVDSTTKKVIDSAASKAKSKKKQGWTLSQSQYKTVKAYDSAQSLLPEDKRDGWLGRKLNIRNIELSERYGEGGGGKFAKDFGNSFKENFSKILFYLLPIFALLLKALYVRRNFFYSEHLVFSIYYYNFFYLAGSVRMLVNLVPWLTWLGSLIGFWIFFYLLFAMKRMYKQGWGKTIAKFLIFDFVFFFFVSLALIINVFLILMFL